MATSDQLFTIVPRKMLAALLGIDTGSWGVIVAGLAFGLSVYNAVRTRGSAEEAKRSRRAAERSAEATVAASEASARSAAAAEISAQHAERTAGASERSADAHERAVELDTERARHQGRERVERDAPRWDAAGEHEAAWWVSDDNHLFGTLVNAGRVTATVTGVELELPTGGALAGRFRSEPPGPADGGFVSTLDVRAGGAIAIEFQTTDGSLGAGLTLPVSPRLTITGSSDELAWHGTRSVELLRRPGAVNAPVRWKPRALERVI